MGNSHKQKQKKQAPETTESKASNPIAAFFESYTVGDVLQGRNMQVKSLKTKDTAEAAILLLSENKILSAPTFNEKGEFVGFVDVLDIVEHIARAAPNAELLKQKDVQNLQIADRVLSWVTLDSIVNFYDKPLLAEQLGTKRVPSRLSVQITDSAASLLPLLAKKAQHRAAVFDKDKLVNIISQSDLIRFFYKKVYANSESDRASVSQGNSPAIDFSSLGSHTLTSLHLGVQPVESVHKDALVIDVLRLMAEKDYGQVPVVGEKESLYANFSASDVRGLYTPGLPDLLLTVDEFLKKYHPESLIPICLLPSSSVEDAVREMVESKLHHLWVIRGSPPFKPIGIVSTTDIMRVALEKF